MYKWEMPECNSRRARAMQYWQWYLANAVCKLINANGMGRDMETSFKINTLIFGRSVFFNDYENNVRCLEFADGGGVPVYPGEFVSLLVTNPVIGEYTLTPYVDCVPVFLTELDRVQMAVGLSMLIDQTADQLADNDLSIRMQQFYKRLPTVFTAKTTVEKIGMETVLQNVADGNPAIIAQSPISGSIQRLDASGAARNEPLSEFTEYQQYVLGQFYAMLGVNSVWNLKRERVAAAENDANGETARYNIADIVDNLNEQLSIVNAMYGTDYNVELNVETMADVETTDDEPETNDDENDGEGGENGTEE